MMMDDSAPTHERRKLIKTYRYMLKKQTVVVEVSREETTLENVIKWSRKIAKILGEKK